MKLKPKSTPIDLDSSDLSHCYMISEPPPWLSLCGQVIKYEMTNKPVVDKCVVCVALLEGDAHD